MYCGGLHQWKKTQLGRVLWCSGQKWNMEGWQTMTKVKWFTCWSGNYSWHEGHGHIQHWNWSQHHKWSSQWNCGHYIASQWTDIRRWTGGETEVSAFICACQIDVYMGITARGAWWRHYSSQSGHLKLSNHSQGSEWEIQYITQSVHCWQYLMTAAYVFTNYCSQGQTLPYVIVDIAKPPSGGLDLFNLYVALSWSLGCEMIQLLCDFNNQMFLKTHDVALLVEDDWMERLDIITREWWQKMGHNKEQTENV